MNHHYLLQFISRQLQTIVRRYSPEGELIEVLCPVTQLTDIFDDNKIYDLFIPGKDIPNVPVLLSVNHKFTYAFVPTKTYSCIIGPVYINHPDFPVDNYLADDGLYWPDKVSECVLDVFEENILLVYNLYRDRPVDKTVLYMDRDVRSVSDNKVKKYFSDLIFRNRECGKNHNPYDQEMRVVLSIEQGDIEGLKHGIAEDYSGEIGTLAKNRLRHTKNLAVVILTLASRAAIRGGVVPEIAYSLFDSYSIQIEECKEILPIIDLFRSAEFEYARMVKEIKQKKDEDNSKVGNPHVNKCKDYISAHLHEKIRVNEIAEALELNVSYLSSLFHECESIPLTEYICREKIKLAKNLLIYSNYSYSEIATYLGFSSQSHLGMCFKKLTNMTMRQFRSAYGVKEW